MCASYNPPYIFPWPSAGFVHSLHWQWWMKSPRTCCPFPEPPHPFSFTGTFMPSFNSSKATWIQLERFESSVTLSPCSRFVYRWIGQKRCVFSSESPPSSFSFLCWATLRTHQQPAVANPRQPTRGITRRIIRRCARMDKCLLTSPEKYCTTYHYPHHDVQCMHLSVHGAKAHTLRPSIHHTIVFFLSFYDWTYRHHNHMYSEVMSAGWNWSEPVVLYVVQGSTAHQLGSNRAIGE